MDTNISMQLEDAMHRIQNFLEDGNFAAARDQNRAVFSLACEAGLRKYAFASGQIAFGLLDFPAAWQGRVKTDDLIEYTRNWNGSDPGPDGLVVRKRLGDIGADLRHAPLIGRLASQFTVETYVDPRLVPLFARSFPSARIVSLCNADLRTSRPVASYELLGLHLTPTLKDIVDAFVPLRTNSVRTKELRQRYLKNGRGRRLVGLSFHSANRSKDLPMMKDWAGFLKTIEADVVSMNYGDREADIRYLEDISGQRIIRDGINQLASLDDLAAQARAVDHIVSVSNTTAHMAAAVGQVTTLVLTAFPGMVTWPLFGTVTPFYPSLRIERRRAEISWSAQLTALAERLNHTSSEGFQASTP